MKILYFSQFYPPESIAAAFRAADHSRLWTEAGNDVTVFTGWPNYPTGQLAAGYEIEQLSEEWDDRVRVLRSKSLIMSNVGFTRRVLAGASFFAYGLLNIKTRGSVIGSDYDVVLASSGTVFAACVGRYFAKRNGIPLVMEIRDITYKQMIATGNPESSAKVRLMRRLELSLCKDADKVIALTDGFKKILVAEGVSSGKVSVVPNGANVVPCMHDWSSDGNLRLGYFGTMGISQDVLSTLGYAKGLFEAGVDISYTLVGEGAMRSSVEEFILSNELPFVSLVSGMEKDELEPYYSQVDMTVVSLKKSESFAETIPSKMFQSWARGVPVLFIGPEGEAAALVRESGAGIALCGTPDENACDLEHFVFCNGFRKRLEKMSRSAVVFMEHGYTRKRMAEKMARVFSELLDEESDERKQEIKENG